MIAYLTGTILEKGGNFIILERDGLGYKIFVTPETLSLPHKSSVSIYTYLKVSDDGQSLYGLATFADLQFFELLITVSGVGPKGALGILSSARRELIEQAIMNQDAAVFTRIAGIGKKTAERIIVELKNKIGALDTVSGGVTSDILEGLLALGYKQHEINGILPQLDNSLSAQEQLKQALKMLSKK